MYNKHNLLKIKQSDFFKNLSVQLIGTFIAQIIPILASLILSRLYSQEAFGVLALFMAIVGVLNVPNAGRYFIAIVKAEDDIEANRLYQLSIITTIGYNILLFFLIVIGYNFLNKLYKLDDLWYYIPIYVLLFGFYNSALFYSVREKSFLKNAKAKIVQTLLGSLISVFIIYFGFAYFGLVIGRFIGLFFSVLMLFKMLPKKINIITLKEVAVKYISYPKLTIIPTMLNIFSLQALIFYAGLYFSEETLGFISLSNIILVAPIALIGMSFRDVYYQKITELYNANKIESAKHFFLKSSLGLFIIGLLLCLVLFFFGEFLFTFVYGKEWLLSGKYASILVFATAIKLVVSPLSVTLNTTNKLNWLSAWQVTYFITLNITLFISIYYFKKPVTSVIILYTIHDLLLYLIYYLMQYRSIKI